MLAKENVSSGGFVRAFALTNSKDIIWIILFAVLTAIGSQIAIPVRPVPFTLQTMMVILAGAFLGSKKGAYSQIVYLFLGIIGLPVFAQTPDVSIGIAKLFGPTGGYLLAFPLGAFVTGFIIERYKNRIFVVLALFTGAALIIILGTIFLNTLYIHNLSQAFEMGASLFSLWMIAKIIAASSIYFSVKKIRKAD